MAFNCFNIDLQWLNTLGGWEHWSFTAFATRGYQIGNVETIKKDIFQNWDTTFIAGGTESEHISIEANNSIIVRSQDLTEEQVNAIARIKISIKVQDETDVDNITTVIVDKASFEYATDNDKRFTIAFQILLPGEIIQTQ